MHKAAYYTTVEHAIRREHPIQRRERVRESIRRDGLPRKQTPRDGGHSEDRDEETVLSVHDLTP